MGYMGLNCVNDSDRAADLAYGVFKKMADELREGLKEVGNAYNTNGCVNVALFIEEYLDPNNFHYQEGVINLVKDTRTELEKHIHKSDNAEWDTEKNKNWHMKAYNRMLKNLNKFLETVKE
jgi:hypothetical protein